MNLFRSIRKPTAVAALAVAAAALIAACGGGGSADTADGSTQNTTGTTSGTTTGTTTTAQAASYAQGPIDGFGSIIVGGVRFDDTNASVLDDDGTSHNRSALKLGMVVRVEGGTLNSANTTALTNASATALRVHFGHEVLGPVSAVDSTASTITVLGQTVLINASTVFDSSITGGLAGIAVGSVIEVHGLPDATTGQIVATRIDLEPSATVYALRGTVSALDTTAKTFRLGGELISYASVTTVPASLADGITLRVVLQTTQVNGAWVATRLGTGSRLPDSASTGVLPARVHGIVTVFTSATSFELNGLKVDATNASFSDGQAAVALGARLEVYGTVSAGVLVATKVELDDGNGSAGVGGGASGSNSGSTGHAAHGGQRPLELHGALSSLDTTAKTFVLRGITVSYAGSVTYKDGTESTLADGKQVEVKGALSADRTRLDATVIDFE